LDNILLEVPNALFVPYRIHIMKILCSEKEISFVKLRDCLQIGDGNLPSHFRYLEKQGFVKYRKEFNGRYPITIYSITEKGKQVFEKFRVTMLKAVEHPLCNNNTRATTSI
jgi:DNA-binding HxlR family transcriptional regulator